MGQITKNQLSQVGILSVIGIGIELTLAIDAILTDSMPFYMRSEDNAVISASFIVISIICGALSHSKLRESGSISDWWKWIRCQWLNYNRLKNHTQTTIKCTMWLKLKFNRWTARICGYFRAFRSSGKSTLLSIGFTLIVIAVRLLSADKT